MATWKRFEDIEAWQMAREFCKDVWRIINYDGLSKDFKLRDQINASSGSVMDNIAEGFERDGNKEFIYFLSISKGSIGESRSQLYRIADREYITEEEFQDLKSKAEKISGKIKNLMTYLGKSDLKGNKFK